jgi:hypothetical protein
MEEPTPSLRPCSTPHSAPVAWLKCDPRIEPPAREAENTENPADNSQGPVLSEVEGLTPEDQHQHDIDRFLADYERIAPPAERRDGWNPFLRKLFLQVIAEGGSVSTACAYTGMSRSSAYSLEARDRVFAAGWAAASHFARNPMADDFYEKARDGITETITRSDGATVTRTASTAACRSPSSTASTSAATAPRSSARSTSPRSATGTNICASSARATTRGRRRFWIGLS